MASRSAVASTALVVALELCLGAALAGAQTTSRIFGRVTDAEAGAPLAGAQIVVEGTELGNVTAGDGRWFVNDVPAGRRRISARYLGYREQVREVRLVAGASFRIDFALSPTTVEAEPLEVVLEAEPLVARDRVVTAHRRVGEEARELPRDDIVEVVTLSPGVYGTGTSS